MKGREKKSVISFYFWFHNKVQPVLAISRVQVSQNSVIHNKVSIQQNYTIKEEHWWKMILKEGEGDHE